MSNKKEELEKEIKGILGEMPPELQKDLANKFSNMVGRSLEFVPILTSGVECAPCFVATLPVDKLQEDAKTGDIADVLERAELKEDLKDAKLMFAGKLIPDGEDLQFFVMVTSENKLLIHSFDNRITKSCINEFIDYLMIKGLENHKLIKRVLHSQNAILSNGAKIIGTGPIGSVVVGLDNSYAVDINMPDDITAVYSAEAPEELRKRMEEEGAHFAVPLEAVCDNNGAQDCTCGICQLRDQAIAKDQENIH